jgi:hypothetical protein
MLCQKPSQNTPHPQQQQQEHCNPLCVFLHLSLLLNSV